MGNWYAVVDERLWDGLVNRDIYSREFYDEFVRPVEHALYDPDWAVDPENLEDAALVTNAMFRMHAIMLPSGVSGAVILNEGARTTSRVTPLYYWQVTSLRITLDVSLQSDPVETADFPSVQSAARGSSAVREILDTASGQFENMLSSTVPRLPPVRPGGIVRGRSGIRTRY